MHTMWTINPIAPLRAVEPLERAKHFAVSTIALCRPQKIRPNYPFGEWKATRLLLKATT
jgi:hypothetical protein